MIHNEVVYLKKRKFKWSSSEASSLGFTFCTDNTHIFQANLEPRILLFEKCLKQWQHRKLTLMGKITVIKNFALPKLIYVFRLYQTHPLKRLKELKNSCTISYGMVNLK